MDHHQSWIITRSKLDHHHHWYCYLDQRCYLSILLVTGISTELSLFHVGCRPSLHVGLHQQSQPFFILDVLPCLARTSPTEPILFHTGCSTMPLARISPTEPILFHTRCSTLPLSRISPTKPVLFHYGCSSLTLARISPI